MRGERGMSIGFLIWLTIFMAILYLTCNKYEYFPNVIIYVVGMGLIPALFAFNGFGNLLIVLLIRFVIGLILIKILTMLNNYFQNGVYFLIAGICLEGFFTRFVLTFIVILLVVI